MPARLMNISVQNFQLDEFDPQVTTATTCAFPISPEEFAENRISGYHIDMFESFPEGVLVVSIPSGDIVSANASLSHITGYSQEKLKQQTIWDIARKKGFTDDTRTLLDQLEQHGKTEVVETTFQCRDGRLITISIQCWAISDEAGKVSAAWSIVKDISAQRLKEHEQQQHLKMDALHSLSTGLAHEFNNILAIILANSELLSAGFAQDSDEYQYAESIVSATERATVLVNQIISCGRLDSFKLVPTDMNSTVRSAISLVKLRAPDGINIKPQVCNAPLIAMANDAQIQQLIIQLCSNAIKSIERKNAGTYSGDISITLNYYAPKSEQIDYSTMRLTIADTGQGMCTDTLSRIFDPLYSSGMSQQGSGLGLSVVQGIVKRHSGFVTVISEPNKGAQFNIDFPVYQDVVRLNSTLTQTRTDRISGIRILLIEEQDEISDIYETYFSHLKCNVAVNHCAASALQQLRRSANAFDCVFMDIDNDGSSCAQIREICQFLDNRVPLVLVSNDRANFEHVVPVHCQSIRQFLKPVDMESIAVFLSEIKES